MNTISEAYHILYNRGSYEIKCIDLDKIEGIDVSLLKAVLLDNPNHFKNVMIHKDNKVSYRLAAIVK